MREGGSNPTLEEAGFNNLVSRFSGSSAYSRLSAQWGYIDHALVSQHAVASQERRRLPHQR
jgi:predicted extracellular nuclease